jgi:predicted amidohydrolase
MNLFLKAHKSLIIFLIISSTTILFTPFFTCNAGGKVKKDSVKIALIHFAAEYKAPEKNLSELVRLNRQAAENGASVILNTEMAVSGYSFNSREDIAPYTETASGKTITAMGNLAGEMNVFIGITFPERDPRTKIFYNSAFILGPDGSVISKYRKIITAEKRWASPGDPKQKGYADTPWGRIGTAICADSYSGLTIRSMALKKTDLLWVPANWPKTGGLDPVSIWRARAMENGFYLAACNRTGKDRTMDCTKTVSAVFAPDGKTLFKGSSETSRIFMVDIPLGKDGKFKNVIRKEKMAGRNTHHYRSVYLRPWLKNLTGFYKLPEPGNLDIYCYVPETCRLNIDELKNNIEKNHGDNPSLWIVPQSNYSEADIKQLKEISGKYKTGIAVSVKDSNNITENFLLTAEGIQSFIDDNKELPYSILHYGPAAVAMVPAEEFEHPELAVSLSKLGTDLVIISEKEMTEDQFLTTRVKSLAGAAVAVCFGKGAQITGVQDMHFGWDQKNLGTPGILKYELDSTKTRKKSFYNDVDFDLLLAD